jgi:F0F1-type ATP synthase assembly protein I
MYGSGDMRSSGQALTIGTSLVASIIVGTGAGWLVDKYLLHSTGTPWGLVCGFMLGVASGFVNLIRVTNQLNKD